MKRSLKSDTLVTVRSGSNWLIGQRGIVVKTLEKVPDDFLPGEQDLKIIVRFPDIDPKEFNQCGQSTIPKEERTWVYFARKDLTIGHAPLTHAEQIEKELKGFGGVRPYIQLLEFKELPDKSCACECCPEKSTTHMWVNVWGSGYRFPVCETHLKKYGPCILAENIPFKTKVARH